MSTPLKEDWRGAGGTRFSSPSPAPCLHTVRAALVPARPGAVIPRPRGASSGIRARPAPTWPRHSGSNPGRKTGPARRAYVFPYPRARSTPRKRSNASGRALRGGLACAARHAAARSRPGAGIIATARPRAGCEGTRPGAGTPRGRRSPSSTRVVPTSWPRLPDGTPSRRGRPAGMSEVLAASRRHEAALDGVLRLAEIALARHEDLPPLPNRVQSSS
jgi:hypothetical protein